MRHETQWGMKKRVLRQMRKVRDMKMLNAKQSFIFPSFLISILLFLFVSMSFSFLLCLVLAIFCSHFLKWFQLMANIFSMLLLASLLYRCYEEREDMLNVIIFFFWHSVEIFIVMVGCALSFQNFPCFYKI